MMLRSILACAAVASLLTGCGPEVHAGAAAGDEALPGERRLSAAPVGSDSGLLVLPGTAPGLPGDTDGMFAAALFSDLDAQVGPRSPGVISAVEVELGDAVRAGQVLARLDDARQRARVESALATRELRRLELERMDSLMEKGFVARQQHEEAHYGLRAAEARLREAEVELEYMRIVAPFDGVVTRRSAGPGRTTQEGDSLFRVTALTPLRALSRVPARDASRITRGSVALVTAETGEQVEAIVARISPAVDPGSGTVEILLDIRRPGSLRPGAAASVRFASMRAPL
jgi:membrane fusion protein, multidrug efflux system